jgi:hypothetical protein
VCLENFIKHIGTISKVEKGLAPGIVAYNFPIDIPETYPVIRKAYCGSLA